MDVGMHLGQSQRLEQNISPQMLQSIAILQKNSLELETAIKAEVEANPMLEFDDEPLGESLDSPAETSRDSEADFDTEDTSRNSDDSTVSSLDFERGTLEDSADVDHGLLDGSTPSELNWAQYLEDGTDHTDTLYRDSVNQQKDPDDAWDRPQKDREASLQDRLLLQLRDWNGTRELMAQLAKAGCPEVRFRSLVEYLIDSLDENGFLQSADEMAMAKVMSDNDPFIIEIEKVIRNEIPLEEASLPVVEAFHVLRSFRPRGIGARNLQECFIIQAESMENFPALSLQILKERFDDLMALRYAKIAKDLGVSTEEVQQAVSSLSRLAPHPGQQMSSAPNQVKVADMKVVEKKGRFEVECYRRRVQKRLHLNQTYASLLNDKHLSKNDREYIQNNLSKAKEFIKAVDNRFSTMENVMMAIVKHQEAFFRQGPAFLKPMILQDIADEVGRDLSTISRVTNGKYVDTPYGIFELKQFFTTGIKQGSAANDEVIGSAQILEAIKKLVDEEDKKKPLSDQAIADALDKQGIKVARRTVAKYREEELKILPARLRKAL